MKESRKVYFSLAFIFLLTAAAYSITINSPFHYDDYHTIVHNPHIANSSNIPRFFIDPSLESGYVKGSYRPIVTASLAVNYLISGKNPWSFHLFNILFHLSAVVAIYLLAKRLLGQKEGGNIIALFSAGLFALHPAHTNAVSYVIARSAILCTLFYVLAFYFYVRARDASGSRALFVASFSFFMLSLLTKELAVTLPLTALLYDLLVRREKSLRGYFFVSFLFAVDLVYVAAKVWIFSSVSNSDPFWNTFPRLLAEPYIVTGYFRLLLLPVNLNFYPDVTIPASSSSPLFLIPAALLAGYIFLIFRLLKKNGLMAFCLAWPLVALIPETVLFLQEPMIQYRAYLPSVGIIILVAAVLHNAVIRSKNVMFAITGLILTIFFILCIQRNTVYRDDTALWKDAVKKSPRSAYALSMLGDSYMQVGRYREAADAMSKAVEMDPLIFNAITTYRNLGWTLYKAGDYENAFSAYKKGLALDPVNIDLLSNLWELCIISGRPEAAIEDIRYAAELNPDNPYFQEMLVEAQRASRLKIRN